MKKKVAVIGAGFAGLSAASCLAQAGYAVTVFEKNSTAGGRARQFKSDKFTFDMGPSWYWMPDVFEGYFNRFGKSVRDYYKLIRLDPSYRVYFSAHEVWDVPANFDDLCRLFEREEPGSSKQLIRFLEEGQFKYELGVNNLVYKPGLSFKEFFDSKLISGVLRLHVFKSLAKYVRQYFTNPRLIQLLEFPVLFLGAAPSNTPALYSLMNYADMSLGTWYPESGMYQVVEAMTSLAGELGVTFRFNSSVEEIPIHGSRAKGLRVNGQQEEFDFIVAGADYHHVEQELLPPSHRRYDESYWNTRDLAPSSLIFFLGVNKKLPLLHHNLFFDKDFSVHTKEIYKDPQWPQEPLFYVCCTSKTDPTVAPDGSENIFILIPVAPGLADNDEVREKYFHLVIDRLEKLTGAELINNIVFKRSYAHSDFIADYNAFKGNAYGLANTLWQTANFKPSIINKRVTNLFYTGQLTVPGPGVPPSIISGQVVAAELIKRDQ